MYLIFAGVHHHEQGGAKDFVWRTHDADAAIAIARELIDHDAYGDGSFSFGWSHVVESATMVCIIECVGPTDAAMQAYRKFYEEKKLLDPAEKAAAEASAKVQYASVFIE